MVRPFVPARYHHTEQLRFKHLARHELFMFPAGHGTPTMGPYLKLSARRYVPVTVSVVGGVRIRHHIKAGAIVHHIGSVNAAVTDRVCD